MIGNLNSAIDTLLSGASHVQSADHLLVPLAVLAIFFMLIGVLIAGLDFLYTAKLKKIAFLKYFFIAGVVFMALDLSYGAKQIATSLIPFDVGIQGQRIWRIVCALFALSIIYILCRSFRDHLAVILISVFGAIFVSSIAIHLLTVNENEDLKYAASNGRTDHPPIIHLVFDELIGAEGIDRDIPGGEEVYQLVRKFHDRFNFRLYGKAFSRHFWTTMSIPNMLNYDYTDETYDVPSKYFSQKKFKFFDGMGNRGYDVKVYQSAHMNFCTAGNIIQCQTLNSFNPTSVYITPPKKHTPSSLPINEMIFSIFLQKAEGSYVSSVGKKLMRLVGNDWYFAERYDVQAFNLFFDKFSGDVAQTKGGEVYFAHFLLPHAPHLLNKNCGIKPISWVNPYYLKEVKKLSGEAFQEARSTYYKMYFEQVSCVYKKLNEFMEKIEPLEHFKNATILINGDHGSRISSGQYFENLSKQDFVDNYSAHFSIRSPDVEPGYDLRSVSIQRLFTEMFTDIDKETSMRERDMIVANSFEKGRIIQVKMPEFGEPSPN